MCLPTSQIEQFYEIWRPLLNFVNEQLKVVPVLSDQGIRDEIGAAQATEVRNALWKNEALLDEFIAKNPAQLPPEDLDILNSWKYSKQGTFFVYKTLKKHAIFIAQDKGTEVFAVKGLYSPFEELFGPYLPTFVKTVLLPFNNEIIADGLFQSYDLIIGPGIRRELKAIYDDAKERGAIITSLLGSPERPSPEMQGVKAGATNTKVLEAFQKHQYKSGSSPKTVERDVMSVAAFAQYLFQQPEPTSLRDFGEVDLQNYLLSLPEKARKPASLGLKRLISFLRDTGRLDWNDAEYMFDALKQL